MLISSHAVDVKTVNNTNINRVRRKLESSSTELSKNRSNWNGKEENYSKLTGKGDK